MFLTAKVNGYIAKCDNPDTWADKRHGRCRGLIKEDERYLVLEARRSYVYCSDRCHQKAMKKFRDIGHPFATIKPTIHNGGKSKWNNQ